MRTKVSRQIFFNSFLTDFELNEETKKSFSDQELKDVLEVPWMMMVLFEGFEEQVKKIIEIYQEKRKKYSTSIPLIRSALVVPPSGFFTEEDILSLNDFLSEEAFNSTLRGYTWDNQRDKLIVQFFMKSKGMSEDIAKLFKNYLYQPYDDKPWDDRELYRIISLIRFEQQKKDIFYGEFLKNNHSRIIKEVKEADFRIFESHLLFVQKMMKSKNVLVFKEKTDEQNMLLLEDMSPSEVRDIMAFPEKSVPLSKHSASLRRALEVARNNDETSYNDIFITLSKIALKISQREEYCKDDSFWNSYTVFQSNINSFDNIMKKTGVHPDMILLVKTIEKYQDNLTMLDVIVALRFMLKSSYVIKSTDAEKSMNIFKKAIEKFENPVFFMKFLTKIFTSHNGSVPTHDEWMNFISDAEDHEVFNYPLSLVIPMITNPDDFIKKSSMKVVEDARNRHSSITLDEDRD